MVEILKLMLGRDSEDEIRSRFVFELVIRTQPSGPLCLWQCLYNLMVSMKVLNRNLRVNSGTGRLIHSTNVFYIQKVIYY